MCFLVKASPGPPIPFFFTSLSLETIGEFVFVYFSLHCCYPPTANKKTLRLSCPDMSFVAPLRRQLPRLSRQTPIARTLLTPLRSLQIPQSYTPQPRKLTTTATNMSYSNTDTGDKPADPYTHKNKEEPSSLKEKVGDLVTFVEKSKFCMMTTRIASSGLLVSRCMALAAKVGIYTFYPTFSRSNSYDRKETALTSSSTLTASLERPTTSNPTTTSTLPSSSHQASGPPSPARQRSRPTARRSASTTLPA